MVRFFESLFTARQSFDAELLGPHRPWNIGLGEPQSFFDPFGKRRGSSGPVLVIISGWPSASMQFSGRSHRGPLKSAVEFHIHCAIMGSIQASNGQRQQVAHPVLAESSQPAMVSASCASSEIIFGDVWSDFKAPLSIPKQHHPCLT